MGIFDAAFSNPETLGLLSAAAQGLQMSGPSRTPVSTGQVIAAMLGGGANGYASGLKMQQDQEDRKLEIELRRAQMQKLLTDAAQKQKLQDFITSRFTGTAPPTQASGSTGAAGGAAAPSSGMPSAGGAAPGFPFSFNDTVALHALGGPNLMDAYKIATDPTKLEGGSTYKSRVDGSERYIPKMGEGMIPNASGVIAPAPGYVDTVAAIEGAKQGATERQKAAYDPLPLGYASPDGRPLGGTRLDYVRGSQVPAQPRGEGLDLSRLTPEQQAFLQKQDPEAFSNGVAHLVSSQVDPQAQGALQSEAEKVAQVEGAKALIDVEKDRLKNLQEQNRKDTRLYGQMSSAIPMARELLSKATGSGAGALADTALGFFGKSTESGNAANQLDTLSGWMTANVPRMEGPQSDRDVIQYKQMAAMVGDRTKPVSARLAALDTLEALQNKYASVNNVTAASPQNDAQPAAPKTWKDFGYGNQQAAIRDAQNAIMRNPSAKAEVIRRLEASGITNHGIR
ncbi:hypothetical protein [Herbaspirillum sp. ST 5-3]|uniref:hypothetical protein n=1 Tax=Oxalobacteraceae TaxID=75682 RepID=UPI0010A2DC63|nr:hypothetical protein [Herbaspirillum sp. ST 5-3]